MHTVYLVFIWAFFTITEDQISRDGLNMTLYMHKNCMHAKENACFAFPYGLLSTWNPKQPA